METKHLHILVVEDEAAHAESVQRELISNGTSVTVTLAGSLQEYRARVAESVPDIAILDLNLPDGKAVEVLTTPAEEGAFPILLMTSHGNEQVAVEAIKAGALDYIVKSPEAFAQLPRTVERALREWHLLIDHQRSIELVRAQEEELDAIYENASMMVNLVVNARDAIEGCGTISITTANAELDAVYCQSYQGIVPGPYICITVSDTGRGVDAATIGQLFEPFFTTKELGKGTGLGLATVYGIVKQNSGEIHVESQPGNGTTFVIHIPRQTPAPGDRPLASQLPAPRGSETILLVEDDESNLQIAQLLLEEIGYSVICSQYPTEACNLYEQHASKIKLLLSDVIMPELNGRELYNRVKIIDPDIKVLFMSGYTDDVITHRGVLPDGVNFIHKPFTISQLAEKVRAVLDGESCS